MQKLFFSMGLIVTGLIAGYLWQKWAHAKGPSHVSAIPRIRKRLQKTGLLFFMPISFVAAVWVVPFENIRVWFLPLIGAGALLLGGFCGLGAASLMRKTDLQKGTLFCCGSFTNIGSIGALVCFVFLGEPGFALIAFYKLFEEIIYYSIGFPVARYFSGATGGSTLMQRIRQVGMDPFFLAATGAFTCGFILNQSGLPRPAIFEIINAVFVPAGTFILLTSIGLGMRFSSVADNLAEGMAIFLIKFIIIPLAAVSAATALGLNEINNGLPVKVVLIASSMPVAFTALVAASIYELDLDLANACWLVTTGSLIAVVPWLAFLLTLF
jgi:predicted permease